MKILLINPPTFNMITSALPGVIEEERGVNPPLGILYIAGYLRKFTDHEVEMFDTQLEKSSYEKIEERIKKSNPDAVGITAMTFTIIDVIKICKIIKNFNPNIKVILGGPHINIYPNETMEIPEVDFLVMGEGEMVIKDLVNNINDQEKLHQITGLVFRDDGQIVKTGVRELLQDLDILPFPAREITQYKKYSSVLATHKIVTTMFTSRGCPYKCSFCDRPHLGKRFRARTAANVVDEMELCQNMGIGEILIYDDTFTIDRRRVVAVCEEYLKRGLKINWDIRARVNTVDTELLKLMKKSGCTRIHYGVEAGTEKILKVLKKGINRKMVKKAFKLTNKEGIESLAYFMIGSPTETVDDIKETIKFAKKIKPNFVHATVLMPFPATDIYYQGLESKVIKSDHWREFAKNPTADFKPHLWTENFDEKELFQLLRLFYHKFYLRPSFIVKKLAELKSWDEFVRKFKAGMSIIKMKKNPHKLISARVAE